MDVDLDAQVTIIPEGTTRSLSPSNDVQRQNLTNGIETTTINGSTRRVFVIETGLDKNSEKSLESNDTKKLSSTDTSAVGTISADCPENTITPNNTSIGTSYKTNPGCENLSTTEENKECILNSVLNHSTIMEPIDLCNSDTDEGSDEEVNAVEMVDNELQSEMESNFMAELGLAANNKTSHSVGQFTKLQDTVSTPKLRVKSISQISPTTFNNMSQNNQPTDTLNTVFSTDNNRNEINSKPEENIICQDFQLPKFVVKPNDHSIHLNKIAIPHKTLFNSQGQNMKRVYLKKPSGGDPLVINSNQKPSSSKNNVTYMLAQQLNKPKSTSPTELFSNVKKRLLQYNQASMQTKQSVLPVKQSLSTTNQSSFPNNYQVVSNNQPDMLNYRSPHTRPNILSHTPKIVKTAPQMMSPVASLHQQDEKVVALVKSLLFNGSEKPYSPPPEVPRGMPVFECPDCHDK